jgi:hypothetical protein
MHLNNPSQHIPGDTAGPCFGSISERILRTFSQAVASSNEFMATTPMPTFEPEAAPRAASTCLICCAACTEMTRPASATVSGVFSFSAARQGRPHQYFDMLKRLHALVLSKH